MSWTARISWEDYGQHVVHLIRDNVTIAELPLDEFAALPAVKYLVKESGCGNGTNCSLVMLGCDDHSLFS